MKTLQRRCWGVEVMEAGGSNPRRAEGACASLHKWSRARSLTVLFVKFTDAICSIQLPLSAVFRTLLHIEVLHPGLPLWQ